MNKSILESMMMINGVDYFSLKNNKKNEKKKRRNLDYSLYLFINNIYLNFDPIIKVS
jgi:hypothetical protein